MRERCDNGEGIYTAMNLNSGSMVQALEIGTPASSKGPLRLGFPSLPAHPPAGVATDSLKQPRLSISRSALHYLVLVLTQSADHIAQYADQILHPIG
jgi:hypothetical protein